MKNLIHAKIGYAFKESCKDMRSSVDLFTVTGIKLLEFIRRDYEK